MMMFIENFLLKIRRKETPFYAFLHNTIRRARTLSLPDYVLPFYKVVYSIRQFFIAVFRGLSVFCYYNPLFRAKCKSVGKGLRYVKLRQGYPHFYGNMEIRLGDYVTVHSRSSFSAGKVFDSPVLNVGDFTYLGPGLSIAAANEISIGSFCHIASNVSISDNDGHPKNFLDRSRGEAVRNEEVHPVKIDDYVWVGDGARILKGVHIGLGAIVAADSVVTGKVVAQTIVGGNPAQVIGIVKDRGER